jgi:hypothetical protein
VQEHRNKQVIRDFARIFKNQHNVDGVNHLFDTKNFIHYFRTAVPPGFEGLRQARSGNVAFIMRPTWSRRKISSAAAIALSNGVR